MTLFKNTLANLLGRLWGAFSSIILFPVYILMLGFENFGFISFSLVLMGLMALFDLGLKATLSRSLARKDVSQLEKAAMVATLETIYFAIALIVFALLFFGTPYIVNQWLNLKGTDATLGHFVFRTAAMEISLQMILRFYFGGLIGLEKQVLANKYLIFWGISRNALVLVPIFLVPLLHVFFVWQAVVTLIFTLLFRWKLKAFFSNAPWRMFQINITALSNIWRFSLGVFLISFVASINTQLDKLIIGRMLSLEHLGVYTLAIAIGTSLIFISSSVSTAILPRLTAFFSQNDRSNVRKLYSISFQVVTLILATLTTIMCLERTLILNLWLNDPNLVSEILPIFPIIIVAYSFLSLQVIPYAVAISQGITSVNNIMGLVSLVVTIPGYLFFIEKFGMIGATWVFCIVQVSSGLVYMFWINARCLHLSFIENFGINFFATATVGVIVGVSICSMLPDFISNRWAELATIFYKLVLAFCIALSVWAFCFQRVLFSKVKRKFWIYLA